MIIKIKEAIKYALSRLGVEVHRTSKSEPNPYALGYVSAKETIHEASRAGMKVADYLEMHWNKPGNRQAVVKSLQRMNLFDRKIENICEIGTGAGLYADLVINLCKPLRYESYEPDNEWAAWLADQYQIISQEADGLSLSHTQTATMDLVLSHGVFVYLPFLTTYRYFQEIIRVARNDAYVVFDILSEECFDEPTVNSWLATGDTYPCMLSKQYAIEFFLKNGFSLKGEFFNNGFGAGKSEYLVFEKTNASITR